MTIRRTALALAAALAGVLAVPNSAPAAETKAAPPAVDTLRVMPLGDSITYGSGGADSRIGNRTGATTAGGYRIGLRARLAEAGLAVDFVGSQKAGPAGADRDHEGHPGWRIDQIAANLHPWLTTYQPDVVLLHLGTNDLAQNRVAGAPQRLSTLIDQIRAYRPYADIFVQRLVQGHVEPYKSRIAAYNEKIPAIVAGKDDRVHLVDQSMIGGLAEFDHLHPNDHGYAKMAHNLYGAMRRVYDTAGTWPTVTDPFTATAADLCFRIDRTVGGRSTWHAECATWTRRAASYAWKRPGRVSRTYRMWVPASYALKKVTVPAQGRKRVVTRTVKVLVPGHYRVGTRTVAAWLSDDPYVTNVSRTLR